MPDQPISLNWPDKVQGIASTRPANQVLSHGEINTLRDAFNDNADLLATAIATLADPTTGLQALTDRIVALEGGTPDLPLFVGGVGNSLMYGQEALGATPSAFAPYILNQGSWPDQLKAREAGTDTVFQFVGQSGADLTTLQNNYNTHFKANFTNPTWRAQYREIIFVVQELANGLAADDAQATAYRAFFNQLKTDGVTLTVAVTPYVFTAGDGSNTKVQAIASYLPGRVGTDFDYLINEHSFAPFATGEAIVAAGLIVDQIHRPAQANGVIAYAMSKVLDLVQAGTRTGVVSVADYVIPTSATFSGFDDEANTTVLVPASGIPLSEYRVALPGSSTFGAISNATISAGGGAGTVRAFSIATATRGQSAISTSTAFTAAAGNTDPAAPTTPLTNDAQGTDTYDWTDNAGLIATEYEYTTNSGSTYSPVTSKPVVIGNVDLGVGVVGVRVKSAPGRNASATLYNTTAFTAAGASPAFVDMNWVQTTLATPTGAEIKDDGGSQFSGVGRDSHQLTASGAGADDLRGSARFKAVGNPGFAGFAHVAPVSGSFAWPDDQVFFSGQSAAVWRGNAQGAGLGSYADTDLWQYDVYNGYVKIYKAGVLQATTSTPPVFPCWFSAVLQNGGSGGKLTACQIKVLA